MKEKAVWLLTSGSYSSYRVHAAFSTKEAADAASAAVNGSVAEWNADYQVEGHTLYDEAPQPKILHWMMSERSGRWDGTGRGLAMLDKWTKPATGQRIVWPWDDEWPKSSRPKVTGAAPRRVGTGGHSIYARVFASGSDPVAVRQAFEDRWAQVRAAEEGIA